MRVAAWSGVDPGLVAEVRASLPARLAATVDATWREMAASGSLRHGADPPTLEVPASFADFLAAAIALERAAPSGRGDALERHYLETMPRLRVEQLATRAAPNATLFHAPLDLARSGHLGPALARIAADTGFSASGETLAEAYRRMHFGRYMPLLYSYPADLAAIGRALDGGAPLETVVERLLAAPLVHEAAHLGPGNGATGTPYVDECLAAWLGVRALPETLWPGEVNALFAAPWLAQVGQALARSLGEERLLAIRRGDEALPGPLAAAIARLGWDEFARERAIHFLGNVRRPDPWMKLFFLAAADAPIADATLDGLAAMPWAAIPTPPEAPFDRVILTCALRAMCLRDYQDAGAWRVERRLPDGAITIDLAACRVARDDAAYLFPPSIAARLRTMDISMYVLRLRDLDALDQIATAITLGAASRNARGYDLTRVIA